MNLILFHEKTKVGIELSTSQSVYDIWKSISGIHPKIAREMLIIDKEDMGNEFFRDIKIASRSAMVFDSIDFNCYLTRFYRKKHNK